MTVERFEPRHVPMIDEWVRARGMGPGMGDLSMYPTVGFVVDGKVVGFLFQTDCTMAYVGGILSDPKAGDRGRALDVLLDALCACAKELGYTAIAGLPSIHELAMRFVKHGFQSVPGHYCIRRL